MSNVLRLARTVKPVARVRLNTGGDVEGQPPLSPMGLYSHAAEMAKQHLPNKVSPQQMVGTLLGKGVKPEELHNAGVSNPLDPSGRTLTPEWASRGPLTKQEAVQHFQASMPDVKESLLGNNKETPALYEARGKIRQKIRQIDDNDPQAEELWKQHDELTKKIDSLDERDPKYAKYTTPNGDNYREVLLKAPYEKMQRVGVLSDGTIMSEEELSNPIVHRTAKKIGLTMEDRMIPTMQPFKSSHWDDPNVLAHVRLSDRTGPNNEKILHVEEIQSDWGQEGREKGFKDIAEREYQSAMKERALASRNVGDTFDKLMSSGISDNDAYNHPDFLKALQNEKDAAKHVGNLNLQMKSGLSTAPHVTSTDSWTDLALKRILKEAAEGGYHKVVWSPGEEHAKRYSLSNHVDRIAYDPEEKTLSYVSKDSNGHGWTEHPRDVEPKDLAGIIGKDAAERLLAEKPNPLNGIHTLETPDLSFGGEGMKGYYDKIVPKRMQTLIKKHDPEAKVGVSNINIPSEGMKPVHSVDITPKMRESILRGQTAFQRGGFVNHPQHIHGTHIVGALHGEPEFTGEL